MIILREREREKKTPRYHDFNITAPYLRGNDRAHVEGVIWGGVVVLGLGNLVRGCFTRITRILMLTEVSKAAVNLQPSARSHLGVIDNGPLATSERRIIPWAPCAVQTPQSRRELAYQAPTLCLNWAGQLQGSVWPTIDPFARYPASR